MRRKQDLHHWSLEKDWHGPETAQAPAGGAHSSPDPLERLEQQGRMRQFREALSPFWAWRIPYR